MDIQNYKAASEQTDEAERALIPVFKHVNTGKPAGIRETQNEQDNREANKAQHSPLTWFPVAESTADQLLKYQLKLAELKAHADKLAALLTDVYQKLPIGTRDNEALYNAISAELAAYESEAR